MTSSRQMVLALLAIEAVLPTIVVSAAGADRAVALRAFAIVPGLLAVGIWTGRRLAQVLARGYAGLAVFAAGGIILLALIEPSAPFTVPGVQNPIPRVVGLCALSVCAIAGWWQWRLLGRPDVVAEFARASW